MRQGGLSSPALFNLYINGLIEALSSEHVGCHIDGVCVNNISYADDMALLSPSVGGIRKLLSICESYASVHGLRYNVTKSHHMVFESGQRRYSESPPLKLYGVPLLKVEQFKYLGHIVTSSLKDDADMERERRALSVRANMIARRFARCSKSTKVTLFRAFCTSLYTCSLWVNHTQRAFDSLRVQYNNALRALLGLPSRCSASGMFAENRIDCFYSVMRKRAAGMVSRIRVSTNRVLCMIADRLDCPFINRCGHLQVARNDNYKKSII